MPTDAWVTCLILIQHNGKPKYGWGGGSRTTTNHELEQKIRELSNKQVDIFKTIALDTSTPSKSNIYATTADAKIPNNPRGMHWR